MALSKKVTLVNNVDANYHRISEVHINFLEGVSIPLIHSYVSSDIRNQEKAISDLEAQMDSIENQMKTTTDEDVINALAEKEAQLFQQYKQEKTKNYTVRKSSYELQNIPDDLSLSNFYKLLSTNDDELLKSKKV